MIKVEKLSDNVRPETGELVTVKEMGNITELMYMQRRNSICRVRKINKDEYLYFKDLETGETEIREYQHNETRADDKNNVRVTLGELRDIINTNVLDVKKCRWVTLTYEQPDGKPMTDTKRLKKDFNKFIKKMHRWCEKENHGDFEYIVAMEPQGSGSWHAHMIMIFEGVAPFITNDEITAKKWGQGYTKTQLLRGDIDNIGAYLSAYLGDMSMEEAEKNNIEIPKHLEVVKKEVENDNGEMATKAFIKGLRLSLYPVGFHMYRYSKGIKKPVKTVMMADTAEMYVKDGVLTYESTISISDEERDFGNLINYRYYNKVRKNKKFK